MTAPREFNNRMVGEGRRGGIVSLVPSGGEFPARVHLLRQRPHHVAVDFHRSRQRAMDGLVIVIDDDVSSGVIRHESGRVGVVFHVYPAR